MKIDPRTATLDAIRDWFAKRDGWQFQYNSWWHPTIMASVHPYPPTRDGAAAAMPSGWDWWREPCRINSSQWVAYTNNNAVRVPDTNNEIDDRYRLAALAAMAMDAKENT